MYEDLDEVLSRLRKVKYGDIVLADDHNDLVDAVNLITKYLKQQGATPITYIEQFNDKDADITVNNNPYEKCYTFQFTLPFDLGRLKHLLIHFDSIMLVDENCYNQLWIRHCVNHSRHGDIYYFGRTYPAGYYTHISLTHAIILVDSEYIQFNINNTITTYINNVDFKAGDIITLTIRFGVDPLGESTKIKIMATDCTAVISYIPTYAPESPENP